MNQVKFNLMLSKTARLRSISVSNESNPDGTRMKSAEETAISQPEPTATPTSAIAKADEDIDYVRDRGPFNPVELLSMQTIQCLEFLTETSRHSLSFILLYAAIIHNHASFCGYLITVFPSTSSA